MPQIYETPKCCSSASSGGVYWMPSWYDGPDKDGWSINCSHGPHDAVWVNVNYCPYCGTKLKTEG